MGCKRHSRKKGLTRQGQNINQAFIDKIDENFPNVLPGGCIIKRLSDQLS